MTYFWMTFFSLIHLVPAYSLEENFVLLNPQTDEIVFQLGPNLHERVTPCSTFKIALCLIGYDTGILKNAEEPVWAFEKSYVDWRESWKRPQSPQSWMKNSCVWYSQVLAKELGSNLIETYLKSFEYGNHDMSGGLTEAWLDSTLKISPIEQVQFIRKMLQAKLFIHPNAIQMTKTLLFLEDLEGGWKLFGKTGLCSSEEEIGWFVGWIERQGIFYPFAYQIIDQEIDAKQRIPRVKELLLKSLLSLKNVSADVI